MENLINNLVRNFDNLKIIFATNDPNSPLKELCDYRVERIFEPTEPTSIVIDKIKSKNYGLLITHFSKDYAVKKYGSVEIISLKDDMEPEELPIRGLDYINSLKPSLVQIDCPDLIIRHLANRSLDFFKDLIDILSLWNGKLEVLRTPVFMNSPIRFLFDDIGLSSPKIFVNRKEEMNILKNIFKEVLVGKGKTVVVSGPPGIGKTALVEEFLKYVALSGVRIYKGRAYAVYSEPFNPYKETFGNQLLKHFEVNQNITNINLRGGDMDRRRVLFYEMAEKIRKMSRKTPLVVFIDDIQWMDPSSLNLMKYLSYHLQNEKIMFIYSYRCDEITKNLAEVLKSMDRDRLYYEIKLHPLSWRDTEELLSAILNTRNIPDYFIDEIFKRTLGNPLFVVSLIKKMQDEGKIDTHRGVYPSVEEREIPKIIKDIYERKLLELKDVEKRIVEIAATYYADVPLDVIEKILKVDYLSIAEYIENLIHIGLIANTDDPTKISIAHPIIKDVVYEYMPAVKKTALHLKIAEAIETLYRDNIENFYGILAHHYACAHKMDKSRKYHILQADMAVQHYAYENALYHYQEALKIRDSYDLHLKIGDILKIMGKFEEAIGEYKKAVKQISNAKLKIEIMIRIVKTLEASGDFHRAFNYVRRILCVKKLDVRDTLKVLGLKGWLLMRMGDYENAKEILIRVIKTAEAEKDKVVLADAYHYLGTLFIYFGDVSKAIDYLKKSLRLRKDLNDKMGMIATLNNLGLSYKKIEKYDDAIAYYKKSLNLSRKIGDFAGIATALVNLGVIYKHTGFLDNAVDCYVKGLSIAKKIEDKYMLSAIYTNLGSLYYVLGELERARGYLEKSLEIKHEIGEAYGRILAQCILGDVLRELGCFDEGQKLHIDALRISEEINNYEGVLLSIISIIDDFWEIDEIIPIEIVNKVQSLKYVDVPPTLKAEVYRIKGILHLIQNDVKGIAEIEEGWKTINQSGNEVDIGIYLLRAGKFLIKHGYSKEGEKYLCQAMKIFKKLEMMKRYEEASKLMKSFYADY